MKPTDKFTLYHSLTDGFKQINGVKVKEEEAKKGIWRGGTVGCMLEDGRIIGEDPRKAVLRYLGIQMPTTFDKNLMFQAGVFNEDAWTELLKANGTVFKTEEEIPMVRKFTTSDGVQYTITGRPDVVVGEMKDGIFVPTLGVELKLTCSFHTAIKIANFADDRPKSGHIVQAAGYSSFFGIPWVLAYTSRVNWPVPYGNPTRSNPTGRWSMDHRALKRDDNGRVYSMEPFISMYDLTWEGDRLLVDNEPSVITKEGILRWYQYCAECIETKTIPQKRGGGWEYDGTEAKKNDCIVYDDFKDANTLQGWDKWISDCKDIAKST